jgi:hypothetical protein
MTRDEIRELQKALNHFVKKRLRLQPIYVDGRLGPVTRGRIRTVKFYLGYLKPINSVVDKDFRQRMWHPNSIKYSTYKRVRRGQERRIRQRKRAKQNDHHASKTTGTSLYHGVWVASAAVPILDWCKEHGWDGWVVSGYRTPAYSESLCYRMCGRPACPGLCAGRATNHAWALPNRFAVDVSNYWKFRQVVARCPVRPRIWNNLPRDPVHFSPSGN